MRWSKRKGASHGYLVENVGIGEPGNYAYVGEVRGLRASPGAVSSWARHHGVCHPGRRFSGDSHFGDRRVPPPPGRALERDLRRHKQLIERLACQKGQATVEFAIIAAGFLAVTVALGALWRMLDGGLIVQHALAVASHHIQAVAPVTITDIFLY